jgi:hypothetical protein
VLVLAIAVAVALLIPFVTRGSYARLLSVEWRWGPLLFAGLAIQIVLEFYTLPRARWDDLGVTLLLASYALILAFCGRNLVRRGMGLVMIGVACNAVAIAANQGMPVKILPSWGGHELAQETVKHQPQQPDDNLIFITDIIVLESPFDTVISFGDLILAVGLCDVAYHASRRRKPRRARAVDLTAMEAAATPILIPDESLGASALPALAFSNGDAGGSGGNGNGLAVPHDPFKSTDDSWVVDIRGS